MKKIMIAFCSTIFFVTAHAQVFKSIQPLAHTFSIVARDSVTGEMAVGVQSHWFSVGTLVPWGEAGVGVVATQSFVDKSYGPKGLALIKQGLPAKLQRAMIQYFLDYNTAAGYTEYIPPFMVNEASAYGTGQLPDKEGQMYHVTEDNFYLIPTAEVPVTNIYRDEILKESDLPIKMTAYSPCFRREAGSFGKDVRGLNRVHQFEKVEIIQIVQPEKSYDALEEMVTHIEQLIQSLELPYRILRLCGGDMGFTSALTYDFEVYSAAKTLSAKGFP